MNDPLKLELTPLRATAIAADAGNTRYLECFALWEALTRGTLKVRDEFVTSQRCYLILCDRNGAQRPPGGAGRSRQILEELLCGQASKVLAFDRSVSASTITMNAKRFLKAIGSDATPSRASLLLVMAAREFCADAHGLAARISPFQHQTDTYHVVSGPLPGQARPLPPALRTVVALMIQGRTNAEIAALRGTSVRTVANQAASAFQRFGVSGRRELIHHLLSRHA